MYNVDVESTDRDHVDAAIEGTEKLRSSLLSDSDEAEPNNDGNGDKLDPPQTQGANNTIADEEKTSSALNSGRTRPSPHTDTKTDCQMNDIVS